MRVSQNQLIGNLADYINKQQSLYLDSQKKLSTGKRINEPSDDPLGAQMVNSFNTLDAKDEQFSRNIDRAMGFLDATESAIIAASDVLSSLRDKATQLANDTYNETDRDQAVEQINIALDQLLKIANEQHEGVYIFGGTVDNQPPFDSLTFQYNGNNTIKSVEISNTLFVDTNIAGSDLFTDTNNGTVDVFQSLIDFRDALQNNDTQGIMTSITNFDNSLEQFSENRTIVGLQIQKLEITEQMNILHQEITTQQRVEVEETDIAKESSILMKVQQILEANYALTGKTQNLSLLNYL
ncbi:flagellar hook-associated protein FlgL [bacterium]|nr:flagellar hook-associated protein FlgL [bacterium]